MRTAMKQYLRKVNNNQKPTFSKIATKNDIDPQKQKRCTFDYISKYRHTNLRLIRFYDCLKPGKNPTLSKEVVEALKAAIEILDVMNLSPSFEEFRYMVNFLAKIYHPTQLPLCDRSVYRSLDQIGISLRLVRPVDIRRQTK